MINNEIIKSVKHFINIIKNNNYNNTDKRDDILEYEIYKNKLNLYHEEMIKYNKKYNIIGQSALNNFWKRNVLNSFEYINSNFFLNSEVIIDVGTGCGIPGVILAIFFSNKKFYLIEKSKVKIIFLEQIKAILKLDNVIIQHTIIEDFQIQDFKLHSICIISRAFKPVNHFIKLFKKYKNIKMSLLKGKNVQEEIDNNSSIINNIIKNKDDDGFLIEIKT